MKRVGKMLESAMCADIHNTVLMTEVNETDAKRVGDSQAIHAIARKLAEPFTVVSPNCSMEQPSQDGLLVLPAQCIELLFSVTADGIHVDCHLRNVGAFRLEHKGHLPTKSDLFFSPLLQRVSATRHNGGLSENLYAIPDCHVQSLTITVQFPGSG